MREKSLQGNERGGAAVEFAILLPVLLLIIFGGIEYGLLMFNKQIITNASREASRAGIVSQVPKVTSEEMITIAQSYCRNFLVTFDGAVPPTLPTVTPSYPDGTQNFGDRLTVTIQYDYQFLLLPFLQGIFGTGALNTLTLNAATTMRYE